MNCGDFRYLIQRRFDVELSSSDDRALLIHLETCESCQKFYHQVQQVIVAAEEMTLPDDLLPKRSEVLSNSIFQTIPHYQTGFLAVLSKFLSRFPFLKMSQANNGAQSTAPLADPMNGDRLKHLAPGRIDDWQGMHEDRRQPHPEPVNQTPVNQTPVNQTEVQAAGAWGAWSGSSDSKEPPLADLVSRPEPVLLDSEVDLIDEQRA